MSDETNEQLSCLVDGELERDASLFLVRRLQHDQDLRGRWDRYHLMRECLRSSGQWDRTHITERVMASLEADPTPVLEGRGWQRMLRPVAGLAVAASVAMAAVVGFQTFRAPAELPMVEEGAAPAEHAVAEHANLAGPTTGATLVSARRDGSLSPRLNGYLLRHGEVAQGRSGFVPYVYIVAPRSQVEPAEAENPDGQADLSALEATSE